MGINAENALRNGAMVFSDCSPHSDRRLYRPAMPLGDCDAGQRSLHRKTVPLSEGSLVCSVQGAGLLYFSVGSQYHTILYCTVLGT
eukprot:COSAG02_NODE_23594_length_713_cov_12645.692182_1_plen_85_part_01